MDYGRMACDHARRHPYVPFSRRHPGLASGVALRLLGVGALGAVLAATRGRRRSWRPDSGGIDHLDGASRIDP